MALEIGTKLGPYEILSPAGAGGMGEVYKAKDTRLDRIVAIKVLPSHFAEASDVRQRFNREAKAISSLNHPNICTLYDIGHQNGTEYLVMEFLEGETLSSRLKRGPLTLAEFLPVAIQIADALDIAHQQGLVHRDLKPGNIMIVSANAVKVLDFGLAKVEPVRASGTDSVESPTVTVHAEATQFGIILGTVAYMSPEQARGRRVDRRSDVWAYGCVLYECLVGKPAFRGETESDMVARILEREPDWLVLPAATPLKVREILKRCLRKDAAERPRDIRDVRLELSELSSNSGKREVSLEKSIAVLPFENLSGPDDEFFADGITSEILNVLTQLEGLRVAARSSCFAFKGRREDLRTVAEKLEVATVLEGTVRRAGPKLRITVQLVNAADGYQLWSERYDREMTDVFEVQDEIANAIAGRLRVSLHGDASRAQARRGTESIEAYELFLKGRELQTKRGRHLHQAILCFEKAIALDPNFAEALAWLADAYRLLGTFGYAAPTDTMPRARSLAERSLAIDPNQSDALATLADVEATYDRNIQRAAELWEKSLASNPRNVRSRCERALWGFGFGILTGEEALVDVRKAAADEPLNAWVSGMHSMILGLAGFNDQSIVEAKRARKIDPDSFHAHWNLVRAYAWGGQYDAAISETTDLLNSSGRHPWVLAALGWTHFKAGNLRTATAIYEEMKARSVFEFISPYWLSIAASSGGCQDEAMDLAQRAVTERDPMVILGRVMPFWDKIRADSRYEEIVRGVWG